jgi:hypothetical protein
MISKKSMLGRETWEGVIPLIRDTGKISLPSLGSELVVVSSDGSRKILFTANFSSRV